jgi:hypothetical protein
MRAMGAGHVAFGLLVALAICACRASSSAEPGPEVPVPSPAVDPSAWLGEVTRSCARASSCAHTHDAPRFGDPSACVDWWLTHSPGDRDALHTCLLAARTCDEVDACTHDRGDARAATFCASRVGLMSGCDGDRFITCSGDDLAESTAIDCASLKAQCGETSMPGGLIVRGCFSKALCPTNAPPQRCEGTNAIVSCHDGAVERVACRDGTRCEEHVDGDGDRAATCEPPRHERCDTPGARYCAADRLVVCEPHGHFGDVRVTDCATLGMRCDGRAASASCVAARVECEPGAPRCDGEALTFCAAGARVSVSCAAIGLGPCDPDAHGAQAGCAARGAAGH